MMELNGKIKNALMRIHLRLSYHSRRHGGFCLDCQRKRMKILNLL